MSGWSGRGRGVRLAGAAAGLLAALLATQPALASVSWRSPVRVTGTYATTQAHALARTSSASGSWLHLAATTDLVNGVVVTDTGPRRGIEYRRSTAGSTWSAAKRLNASGEHGDFAAVAASGRRVFVAWRGQTHIDDFEVVTDPTPLRLRVNDDHGRAGAWRARTTLVQGGRIDRPSIAASGDRVLVAWTDRGTGEIRVARSTDAARSFRTPKALGATVRLPFGADYGYVGVPVVAIAGRAAAVAWVSDVGILVRRSTDGGRTWGSAFGVTASVPVAFDLAVKGDRVALAWLDGTGGWSRVRVPGAWHDARQFAAFGEGQPFTEPAAEPAGFGGVAVALSGTAGLAVAWSACSDAACPADATRGSSVLWRESRTNGTGWKARTTVASFTAGEARRRNRAPSIVLAGATTRYVAWLATPASGPGARAWVRKGTGTP